MNEISVIVLPDSDKELIEAGMDAISAAEGSFNSN
jgi:hypothetical protein